MVVLHGKLIKLWFGNPCDQNRICLRHSLSEMMHKVILARPSQGLVIVSTSLSGEIRLPGILPTPDRDR